MARIVPLVCALLLGLSACSGDRPVQEGDVAADQPPLPQPTEALLAGESMAVAYSGYREGQHPDRGDGEIAPTHEQILEDLQILADHGFSLIRLYDSGANSTRVLEVIREHQLPFKVLLGAWLDAELSNHEGCPWLETPIPEATLDANRDKNLRELDRLIGLAREYRDIVVAVNDRATGDRRRELRLVDRERCGAGSRSGLPGRSQLPGLGRPGYRRGPFLHRGKYRSGNAGATRAPGGGAGGGLGHHRERVQ